MQPCSLRARKGRQATVSLSSGGRYFEFVYASRRRPVRVSYQCRSFALKQIQHPQRNAFDILVHVPSNANAHLKDEYELLTVISIKKKATQTYPTNRQNTVPAFVQGIPILSWTMK